MTGVFLAQLFRLSHSPTPDPRFGFFVIGVPMSSICQSMAILLLVIGTFRYIKIQKNMALGMAISGGWEINLVAVLAASVRTSA
jgi:hypothetical protein